MTYSVVCPKGDVRWKSVYRTDYGNYEILMLDHSYKLRDGSIRKMPINITYCIQSQGYTQFVRSDDLNEVKDFMGMLVWHSIFI
jgi:hypothetical protein